MSCEYQPECPGCPRYGSPDLSPERVVQLQEIARLFDSRRPPEFFSFDGLGSRHRARLSVRGRRGDLKIGIFKKGSHHLVSIPNCGVHHPSIRSLIHRVVDLSNQAGVTPYDETHHRGELRAVQFAVEPSSGRVQLVLLINRDLPRERPSAELTRVCEGLETDELVQGLFLGALSQRDNSLLASHFQHVSGAAELMDVSLSTEVFFPPGAFGQANPVLHQRVLERISSLLPETTRIVEYYSGVGALGLGLAARGHELRFNECGTGSVAGLRLGWDRLGRGRALPLSEGRAGQYAELYEAGDTVVVDPPRKGLDGELLSRFLDEPPLRLIYLSCGIDALLRESRQIAEKGRFSLRHLSGWAYFPFTDHVETLLVLERND